MSLRAFSYGGGMQSTAALVLAAEGEIDFPTFFFANVGEDSENPATITYVHEVAMPYAKEHGIEVTEVRRVMRDGSTRTLMEQIHSSEKSIPIPVRMENGAPGNRSCTGDFKIKVIEKELRRRGATKEKKATLGLGISLDEWHRAGTAEDPRSPYQLREYPLIDRRISRDGCHEIIRNSGLPLPERSACYFCPFHKDEEWRAMVRKRPDLFEKACQLEDEMHERGEKLGRGAFYFTRHGRPLRDLFSANELVMFEDDDSCESGYCMT